MKKVLSLVATLAALAGTATAAPYYLPQPAGGALTPYDIQPVYSLEGLYNFVDNAPDTAGARLSLSLYSNAASTVRHQFSLNAAYEYGSGNQSWDIYKAKLSSERSPITLGYDVNIALSDSVLLDLGVKAGYAFGMHEVKYKEPEIYDGYKRHEHMAGFTYNLGAGIKVVLSEAITVKLGYEFGRTYYRNYGTQSFTSNQHSIVAGVGVLF